MYLPAAFAESDLGRLHDFMRRNSFGLVVSQVDSQPFATHLPLLLETNAGPHGTLIGHLAENPQWRQLAGQTALAVFTGPHAYISPTWYEAEHVVPTWNYLAVHVYGKVNIIEEEGNLLAIVREFVDFYEAAMPKPWSFDGSSTFAKRMLAQIVGFRMTIEKIEGKWKLNQNHPVERRQKVIRKLREQQGEDAMALAETMEALLPEVPFS